MLTYPDALPGPISAPFQPAERRLLSSLPGPRNARPMQRDRKASQTLDFIFTHNELAIFEAWVDGALVRAGAWFAASWPQPQGGVGVRRFVGEPSYPTHYPQVGWHVVAEVEVRGRGELPGERYEIDLDALVNASATAAVGVVISGLDPAKVYTLSLPPGRTYTAWRPNVGLTPNRYRVSFQVTSAGGQLDFADADFTSAEAARAAFAGGTITGHSSYTFWIYDAPTIVDNDGGVSVLVRG